MTEFSRRKTSQRLQRTRFREYPFSASKFQKHVCEILLNLGLDLLISESEFSFLNFLKHIANF